MKTKTCSKCGEHKPSSEFYQRNTGSSLHSVCKQCERDIARDWYYRNRDAAKKKYRDWRKQNADKIAEYRKRNRAKSYRQECSRKYGVAATWIDEQLVHQSGCCAICGSRFEWGKKQLCPHVDHNHKTGEVRALLCNRCNSVIGLTGESVTILKAMEEYLCHGYSAGR